MPDISHGYYFIGFGIVKSEPLVTSPKGSQVDLLMSESRYTLDRRWQLIFLQQHAGQNFSWNWYWSLRRNHFVSSKTINCITWAHIWSVHRDDYKAVLNYKLAVEMFGEQLCFQFHSDMLSTKIFLLLAYFSSGVELFRLSIVNGIMADSKKFPYQLTYTADGQFICGACLISNNFALTAGE